MRMSRFAAVVTVLCFLGAIGCGEKKATEKPANKAAKQKKVAKEAPKTVDAPPAEAAPAEEPKPAVEAPAEKPKKSAPGKVVLDYYKGGKAAVPFDHKAHTKAGSCKTCHHDERIGCSECHGTSGGDAPSLKTVFHDNCKGCHKALVKENPESPAPTKCAGCHK